MLINLNPISSTLLAIVTNCRKISNLVQKNEGFA